MNFLNILGVILLALGALFFGGCAVMFAPYALTTSGDPGGTALNLLGFALAGLCIWGIVRLFRKPPPGDPEA